MSQVHREPRRLVVFGVTGQLGQELVDRLDESDWPLGELAGVASSESVGSTFEFRALDVDVASDWPVLKDRDLVLVATRGVDVLEIVRECLKAEVPCVDLTGALSAQREVPMPFVTEGKDADEGLEAAPLLSCPSPTALAMARVTTALGQAAGIVRLSGTVLCSASAHGRRGVQALSEESIALFNQSEGPAVGPAGQAVAFDVVPGGGVDADRVAGELLRVFGAGVGIDVSTLQVPTFVGEGTSLVVELAEPVEREALVSRLEASPGITVVVEGIGSRGLAPVTEEASEPAGPTLRDAAGVGEVLVGRIESDDSRTPGLGWRLWLTTDPVRLAAEHALAVAGRRLGIE